MRARVLIFYMSIPSGKTFQWYSAKISTLWPWPWSIPIFCKTKLGNLNASARALIIHLSVSNDKMFPLVPTFFYPVTLTLEFGLLFEKFNLANNFSTVNASVMIFQIIFHVIKIFLLEPFWPWHWPILKKLNLS